MTSSASAKSPSKRGSYAKNYSKEGILAALQEYKQQQSLGRKPSFRSIGQQHNIPESTLRDYHVRSLSALASAPHYSVPNEVVASLVSSTSSRGISRLLDGDVEEKLKKWIDDCGDVFEPPTREMVKVKAKRLYFATHNIPITSENELDTASFKWWRGFKKRHPTISVRRIQPHD